MDAILDTDQYKFAMAEAGWPLREETFYYSHRKGGPHLLPVDVREYIKDIFSKWATHVEPANVVQDRLFKTSGLQPGAWFKHFYDMDNPFDLLKINTLPKGSWFFDRDPVFTVTGPSFLLSWLEPQVLQLHYRIQVATLAAKGLLDDKVNRINLLTCDEQKRIVEATLETVRSFGHEVPKIDIYTQPDSYVVNVESRVRQLVDAVGGDAHRIFEVGLRAATCGDQHDLALQACRKAGVLGTSDTFGAVMQGMRAVGTMGHEHVQRFGSDEAAYNAMAERMPGSIFCLLDTYDTLKSGIPAAFDLIRRQPERDHAVRFDSGDIFLQLTEAIDRAGDMGINPRYCLEDGWNLEKTKQFEEFRKIAVKGGLSPDRFLYGFGGYIVNCGWTSLTRDRVSAVWKVTQSGDTPTMKFGSANKKGKESIPGKPILWRLHDVNSDFTFAMPKTVVAQEGESIYSEYGDLYTEAYTSEPMQKPLVDTERSNAYSDATKILRHTLYEKKLETTRRSKEKWQ